MNKDLINQIIKQFELNLRYEDLFKPGYKFYIGRIQKKSKKAIRDDYRLYNDLIIEIPGFEDYTIGIRSYRNDDNFWDKPYLYWHFFRKTNDKFYDVKSERKEVKSILHGFDKIYKYQQLHLPCHGIIINGVEFIELLANIKVAFLYNKQTHSVEIIEKDTGFYKHPRFPIDKTECISLHETAPIIGRKLNTEVSLITNLKISLTIKEYLFGYFLKEYSEILNKVKEKRGDTHDITEWIML